LSSFLIAKKMYDFYDFICRFLKTKIFKVEISDRILSYKWR
jgi:hypothetical protein